MADGSQSAESDCLNAPGADDRNGHVGAPLAPKSHEWFATNAIAGSPAWLTTPLAATFRSPRSKFPRVPSEAWAPERPNGLLHRRLRESRDRSIAVGAVARAGANLKRPSPPSSDPDPRGPATEPLHVPQGACSALHLAVLD